MKKLIVAIAALVAVSFTVQGQVTNAPTSFYESTLLYFSTIDTNMTFTPGKMWVSADYINNVNWSGSINASYDVWQPKSYANGLSFGFEAGCRNAGIAGALVDAKGGLNVAYNHYSVRLEGYADAGYRFDTYNPEGEVGARVLKKPTPNTFFGIGMGLQFPQVARNGPMYPVVQMITGFTF